MGRMQLCLEERFAETGLEEQDDEEEQQGKDVEEEHEG